MSNQHRQRRQTGGIAGLFAFFLQLFAPGPTVDFKPVGDTYQAADTRHRAQESTALAVVEEPCSRINAGPSNPVTYTSRYRERSRFDSRGAIVDLRG